MRSRSIIASICAILFAAAAYAQDFTAYEDEHSAPSAFTSRWVLPEDGVRLRDKPSTDGKTLGIIPAGAKLEVLEKRQPEVTINDVRGNWLKVKSPIGIGWSFSGFLRPYDTVKLEADAPSLVGSWAQADGSACEFTDANEYFSKAVTDLRFGWHLLSEQLILTTYEDPNGVQFGISFLSSNRLELETFGMRIVLYRIHDERYDKKLDSLSAE